MQNIDRRTTFTHHKVIERELLWNVTGKSRISYKIFYCKQQQKVKMSYKIHCGSNKRPYEHQNSRSTYAEFLTKSMQSSRLNGCVQIAQFDTRGIIKKPQQTKQINYPSKKKLPNHTQARSALCQLNSSKSP